MRQPQLVEVTADGQRHVRYDFAAHLDRARPMVRLDVDGRVRAFDHPGKDSTGAAFALAELGIARRFLAAEGAGLQWVDGFAAWCETLSHHGPYRGYLGTVDSGWVYSGVYILMLPASMVTAGKPLELSVHVPSSGGGDWFMVHEYHNVLEATADVVAPRPGTPVVPADQAAQVVPVMPVITAFTPHLDGQFGVTMAEFSVELAPDHAAE
jgi:hypothetical protein